MLQETASRFLEEHSSSAVVRAAAGTDGLDRALWQRVVAELGWQAIPVPEADGGLDLGPVELAIVFELTGRRLTPTPHFASALSALAVRTVPDGEARQRLLAQLAEGAICSLAHTDARPHWGTEGVAIEAQATPEGWSLSGAARFVGAGHAADELLVVARSTASGKLMLCAVPADSEGVTVTHQATLDQSRSMANLYCEGVHVGQSAVLCDDWEDSLAVVLNMGRILVAAEQVGCAQAALDMSVAYTGERIQFGRTIASFQAIKHKAADMMLKTESARSLLYYAACTADAWLRGAATAQALEEAAHMVASSAGDAAFFVAGTAIQLHGGVGITEEYDVQLYFKRARALESYLGRPDESRELIAGLLLDAPSVTGEQGHAA